MRFTDEDIHAIAVALKEYDTTAVNKSWRDLAIVAISAMTARSTPVNEGDGLDREALVRLIHKQVKPQTFGEAKTLDAISAVIFGSEQDYETWLDKQHA